jgi:hypothetical protein
MSNSKDKYKSLIGFSSRSLTICIAGSGEAVLQVKAPAFPHNNIVYPRRQRGCRRLVQFLLENPHIAWLHDPPKIVLQKRKKAVKLSYFIYGEGVLNFPCDVYNRRTIEGGAYGFPLLFGWNRSPLQNRINLSPRKRRICA